MVLEFKSEKKFKCFIIMLNTKLKFLYLKRFNRIIKKIIKIIQTKNSIISFLLDSYDIFINLIVYYHKLS